MLQHLIAAYAEAMLESGRHVKVQDVEFDKPLGERTLDVWARLGWGELFVHLLAEKPSNDYVEDFLRFCEQRFPEEAWLIYLGAQPTSRRLPPKLLFENRLLSGTFRTMSVEEVIAGAAYHLTLDLRLLNGRPALVFEKRRRR